MILDFNREKNDVLSSIKFRQIYNIEARIESEKSSSIVFVFHCYF